MKYATSLKLGAAPFVLAMFSATFPLPSWANTYSFAAVKDTGVSAQDVGSANYNYTDSTFLSNTGLAAASGVGNSARAQTLLGVNRVEVSNSIAVDDEYDRQTGIGGPFAIALSGWTDDFVVTGGTGSGTALISVNVTGQIGMGYGSAGAYGMWLSTPDELEIEVTEFLSTDPTAWLLETRMDPEDGGETLIIGYEAYYPKPGYTDSGVVLGPGAPFGGLFTTKISFTYGQTFSIASVLAGFANDYGSLSAMNSAHFGISVLDNTGAVITTGSGAVYAAAVPEPHAFAMFLPGLAILAYATARRNRRFAAKS